MLTTFEHNPIHQNEAGYPTSSPYNTDQDEIKDSSTSAHPKFRGNLHLHYPANTKHGLPHHTNQKKKYRSISTCSESQHTSNHADNDYLNDNDYFQLIFKCMIKQLMTNVERKLYYLAIFCTFLCAILRLSFFIFITVIIDLLADPTFHGGFLHALCPQTMLC